MGSVVFLGLVRQDCLVELFRVRSFAARRKIDFVQEWKLHSVQVEFAGELDLGVCGLVDSVRGRGLKGDESMLGWIMRLDVPSELRKRPR